MKSNRGNVMAALDGNTPERIPYTLYGDFVTDISQWDELFGKGLSYMPRVTIIKENYRNVEKIQEKKVLDGKMVETLTFKTPVGVISQVSVNNWIQEYFLKTPADYKAMKFVIEDAVLELNNDIFIEKEKIVGERGITLVRATRTPFQRICVDFAGLENFSFHLCDEFPEFYELIDAIGEQVLSYYSLISQSPAKYIQMPENLTSVQSGPRRFEKYHMPYYSKISELLHSAGKKIYAHCDGKLSCLAELIGRTGLDGIESFTLPSEGDLSYEEAREKWPEKIIWNNINVTKYQLPENELKKAIHEAIEKGSVKGSRFLFDISEECPQNWRVSIPVVLEAISEYSGQALL